MKEEQKLKPPHTPKASEVVSGAVRGLIVAKGAPRVVGVEAPIDWYCIASSSDGSKLVAATITNNVGSIYVSTNYGVAWIQTQSPIAHWYWVASYADGNKIIAAAYGGVVYPGGGIFTSTNGGVGWISNNLPDTYWVSVSSSADGNSLVASTDRGGLYFSTNSGVSWASNDVSEPLYGTASSADGKKLFAKSPSGDLYTLQMTPTPQLHLTPSPTNFVVSWIVPSRNFILKQSSDLISWTNVKDKPLLNPTNLTYEVSDLPTSTNGFFRLSTQ
jgi:hypothetical protein